MGRKLIRRAVAALLVVSGGALLWLSPDAGFGTVMMIAAVVLEALGIRLDHV